jgi:hypothetical protein
MFTGKPIAFSKGSFGVLGGKFADLAKKISDTVKAGKEWLNNFKKDFINPLLNGTLITQYKRYPADSPYPGEIMRDENGNALVEKSTNFLSPLSELNAKIDKYTENNYAGLQASLPGLFSNTDPSIVSARNSLLDRLGKVDQAASYRIGPFTIGELSEIGTAADTSFVQTMRDFHDHTNQLAGVSYDSVKFTLERLYGNVAITGATANIASSTFVSPNLRSTVYPVTNIGDLVVINSEERRVIDKGFTAAPAGTVSIYADTVANSVIVTSASVATLNLADCLLDTSGTLKVSSGVFINVNNEIRQVNSINALGDYLTVYVPFRSTATAQTFYKETTFTVNTAFSTTATDQIVNLKSEFIANSLCLDNVITGRGTSFTTNLAANNKIYYDEKEYFVISVTDTTITVDEPLRFTNNFPIFKVTGETAALNFAEDSNSPDDILTTFSLVGQLTNDKNFLDGFTTSVRRANGTYQTVNASNASDSAQSLLQAELLRKGNILLQEMINDLRGDAINKLTTSQVVAQLTGFETRISNVRNEVKDAIEQDLAVINKVKGLLKGLIKLFTTSCSKKKRKDGDGTSDDYLDLILVPNPERQGCDATESDFTDILDDIDVEFNDPQITNPNTFQPPSGEIPTNDMLNPGDQFIGPYPPRPTDNVTDDGLTDNLDGVDPDVKAPEDPCAKPC